MSDVLGPARVPVTGSALGDLVLVLVLVLLAITGAFERVFASASSPGSPLQLGAPRVVAMSASEAAEAAHLLGASVAQLWTDHPEPEA